MIAMRLCARCLLVLLVLAQGTAVRAEMPVVQAALVRGREVTITLKVINPLPDAIVLLSADTPSFRVDAKACFMTVTSVVTSDLPEFAFTPGLTRVESKGTWTATVAVPRDLLKRGRCRNWTFQIELAYLTAEDASAPKFSRNSVIQRQRVIATEKLHLAGAV